MEEYNAEKSVNFETNFSNQVSAMQKTLSAFKIHHAEALNTLAADHGRHHLDGLLSPFWFASIIPSFITDTETRPNPP